ncbi:MAG: MBL fold metallo-hydrolase [Ruminococcaceae bacterium]|nr:MBL fold metallo-hydrolase [Oscillospiraceae bacterium]
MKLRRILALLLTALLCLCLTACGEKGPSYSPTKSPYAMKWECNAPQIAAENGEIHFYFMSGEGMNVNPENEKGQTEKWGDSCLVIFPDGKTMLIDGGFPIYAAVLTENLQRLGVTHLDYVVLSHSHNDHYGGLESPQGPIKVLGASHGFYSGRCAPACMSENGLTTQQLLAGDTVQLGEVKLTCLSPTQELLDNPAEKDPETATNNASMVLRIDYKEFSALFTGDIYKTMEQKLVTKYKDTGLMDVDLLKLPHHGDATSNTGTLADATTPKLAAATGALPLGTSLYFGFARYAHTVLHDAQDGYAHVWSDGESLEWETSRERTLDMYDAYDAFNADKKTPGCVD